MHDVRKERKIESESKNKKSSSNDANNKVSKKRFKDYFMPIIVDLINEEERLV